MNVRSAIARLLLSIVLLVIEPDAQASSVLVRTGTGEGQGYAVTINRSCLVLVPNHVIGNSKKADLFSAQGEKASAAVFRRNPDLDLAVLAIARGTQKQLPQLCAGERTVPVDVHDLLTHAKQKFWLVAQRVPTSGGSVDHVPAAKFNIDPESPWLSIDMNGSIAQGDSGATVWSMTRAPTSGVESNGSLVGMVMAVEAGGVRVLRADHLQQAVYQMLWPIKPNLRLGVGERSDVVMKWGPVPRSLKSNPSDALNWNTGAATVHFVVDLGDRDTTVRGVYASRGNVGKILADFKNKVIPPAFSVDHLRIAVRTSQTRPNESELWTNQSCSSREPANSVVTACEFRSPMVIRGLIVQLEGDLPNVSDLSLLSAD